MIDEITALMPMIDKIADGALWAFVIYMTVKVVGLIVWPVILLLIISKIVTQIPNLFGSNIEELDVYELKYKGVRQAEYIGSRHDLKEFLNYAKGDSDYVHGSDLRKLMKET